MIDFATGYYTGSIFKSQSSEKLPGQGHCDKQVGLMCGCACFACLLLPTLLTLPCLSSSLPSYIQVSVVKAHPNQFKPDTLLSIDPAGTGQAVRACTSIYLPISLSVSCPPWSVHPPTHPPTTARCNTLGQITGFDRFILLTRNPFDAIWSEYRRSAFSVVITKDKFDRQKFDKKALVMAGR